jgi:hydrogenase maturation protein HypF
MTLATPPPRDRPPDRLAVQLRVRGRVQGVGFRPTVWRIATALGLDGDVRNDAEGVLIRLAGPAWRVAAFQPTLEREMPPLARIESIDSAGLADPVERGFAIADSVAGETRTQVSPDARTCEACAAEILDPAARRFGYALTNCTHCGPRLSIIRSVPYDRTRTTMAPFPMCQACSTEYRNPADRRFHAEPTACAACGPTLRLVSLGRAPAPVGDPLALAARMLQAGEIIAIKGLGGYQLACDATNAAAVARLRHGKRREAKPFALMASGLDVVRRYCVVSVAEAQTLASPQAPIVLLAARTPPSLPQALAPGLSTLGFMLPTTPLHLLLMQTLEGPLVMTSGNLSNEPQIIDDGEALARLGAIASHALVHDRAIANRLDDSVVRVMDGVPRLLRRARGYAPAPVALPEGFAAAPHTLAMGGELKATFCLIKDGQAILSQHQGDLEHPAAFDGYNRSLELYRALFDHRPEAMAVDRHPEYLSAKLACAAGLPLIAVRHHHAHIAACLCENGYPLDAPPVVGVALDGLGWGDDGTFWGGEFLLADYRGFQRLASLKPVAMAGGTRAVREPWRNLYAHIRAALGWERFAAMFPALDARTMLAAKPLAMLDAMIATGLNAPLASSCGRLFDAVAAALGLCCDAQAYEGEAACRLEALAESPSDAGARYPFAHAAGVLDPAPMWIALFEDLAAGAPAPLVAARFHASLAEAVSATAARLADEAVVGTIALSGGCFQNRLLFEAVTARLRARRLTVLTHSQVPANDGGLSLGQAAVAAARFIRGDAPCA